MICKKKLINALDGNYQRWYSHLQQIDKNIEEKSKHVNTPTESTVWWEGTEDSKLNMVLELFDWRETLSQNVSTRYSARV